jgi:glycosyltransferase involved in cell wall biosynthesis
MIETLLQLAIFTYNRADSLRRTLDALAASPASSCRLTILDNASTDHTEFVCSEALSRFPQIRVIRHPKNIGASPNYLRAVETIETEYAWILGDDDVLDFSSFGEVVDALATGKYDLVSVGSPAQEPGERGVIARVDKLLAEDTRFFSSFTFVTGVIFRTSLFDSKCVFEGYKHVQYLYPHFPFVYRAARESFLVYVTARAVVIREDVDPLHLSYYTWLKAWVNCCAMIQDSSMRRKAIYDFSVRTLHPKTLAIAIARERAFGREIFWRDIFYMLSIFVREQKLLWITCWPLLLVPAVLFRCVRQVHVSRKYVSKGLQPPDRNKADPLRL